MSDNTKIEWADATWNPITGCSVVSAGCTNCYAMRLAGTRLRDHPSREGLTNDSKAGPVWNGQVRLNEQWLDQPMRWRKPRRIFVCAHGDLFHENVPDEWIDRVFAVMALSPHHTFQVLTKRPGRMQDYMNDPEAFHSRSIERLAKGRAVIGTTAAAWPLPNVWLGTSVENQTMADERIPLLLDTPAAIRWISAEPLLGPVDLTNLRGYRLDALHGVAFGNCKIDWVVAGGESGPSARPMHPDWARSLRDQCHEAGVPFHFKQWGQWYPCAIVDNDGSGMTVFPDTDHNPDAGEWEFARRSVTEVNGQEMVGMGKNRSGRHLDGTLHDAYPETSHAQRERLLGEMARVDAEYLDLKYL